MDQGHNADVVSNEWLLRHGIKIPRKPGTFKSSTHWVRVDEHGVIVQAGESDQTALATLVDMKVLSSQDVDYAIDYVTCRNAERTYRKQKGFKSGLDFSFASVSAALSCEQAAMVFCLTRQQLGQRYVRIVEYACDTMLMPGQEPKPEPLYRKAFTALAKSMERSVRLVSEGKVSDEPQKEAHEKFINDAGLKKFLAPRNGE